MLIVLVKSNLESKWIKFSNNFLEDFQKFINGKEHYTIIETKGFYGISNEFLNFLYFNDIFKLMCIIETYGEIVSITINEFSVVQVNRIYDFIVNDFYGKYNSFEEFIRLDLENSYDTQLEVINLIGFEKAKKFYEEQYHTIESSYEAGKVFIVKKDDEIQLNV